MRLDLEIVAPEAYDPGFFGAHELTLSCSLPEHPTVSLLAVPLGIILLPSCTSGNYIDLIKLEDMIIHISGGPIYQILPEVTSYSDSLLIELTGSQGVCGKTIIELYPANIFDKDKSEY